MAAVRRNSGFCLAPIDVSERLAVSIKHFEAAQAAGAWNLLNGPWWGKASARHRCAFIVVSGIGLRAGHSHFDPSVAHRFGMPVITAAGLGLPRMLSNVASINSCAPALYKSAINPTVFCAAPLTSHRQLLKELVLRAAGRSPL